MKFDKIIMNPPYNKNLHLKILSEAMKHADEIVNLSPIRWLQDPLAKYKKNSDFKKFENIRKHIESLNTLDRHETNKYFSILSETLGIYRITPNGKGVSFDASLIDKIVKKTKVAYRDMLKHPKTEFWEPVAKFHWTCGDEDSEPFTLSISKTGIYAKTGFIKGLHDTYEIFYFDTKEELSNFQAFLQLKSYKCILTKMFVGKRLPVKLIPFVEDYTHKWTDEDLYKYFNLTEDEIKQIETTIKRY